MRRNLPWLNILLSFITRETGENMRRVYTKTRSLETTGERLLFVGWPPLPVWVNLMAMAANLIAMAANPIAMASNLVASCY